MTESELIALRSRLASRCLPDQVALASDLVRYPERWAVAACLRNGYRREWTKHVEPHGALYRSWSTIASLHPACVRDLIDHPDAVGGISFEICNEKHSAVPFQAIGEGIGKTSSVLYPGWGELQQPFFRYQLGGIIEDEVLVLGTYDSRGGASVDSGVVFVRLGSSLAMALEGWEYIGDRCNRGLKFVRADDDGSLSLTINITSYDLFALDDWRRPRELFFTEPQGKPYRSEGLLALRPYKDLENFANIECLGSATYAIDLAAHKLILRSATIARIIELMADRFAYQPCFNTFMTQRFAKLPVTIEAAALPALTREFERACTTARN